MNGSDRRRGSKWDTKEDGSPENRRGLARCNKTGSSFHEHESRDYMSGRRGLQRDFRMNEESMLGGGHYTRRTSPGPDGRRLQSRSRSPRRSRGRSYRSRSRSRSPAYNLQREPGVHRSSSKSAQSAPLCREFAAGRCKKGDLCRFAHHSSPNHDTWRHFESKTGDGWDSRRGNDGASRHHSEPYSGGRSTQICNEFLKGRCTRGVSCKYRHSGSNEFIEGATDASHRDGVNDWRSKSGSSYDRDAHIGSEPICKFFAAGNCRNGKHCKFSHQRDGQFNSERRSPDGRQPEHNSEGMNRVRNDRNWGDRSSLRRVPEASGWEIEGSGFRDPQRSIAGEWSKDGLLNHELGDPTYTRGAASTGNEKMENIEHQSFQWKSNDVSVSETKALEKGLSEGKMLSPKGTFNSQSSDSLPFLQTSLSFGEQDTARRASAENTYLSGIMHNNVSGEYSQPKPSFPVDITPGARNNGSSHVNVNILGDIPHGQGLHQDGGLVAQPFSTVDTVGQSQTTFPLHPPGGEQMQIAHHLPVIDTNTAMGQCQSMFPPSLNQNQGMQMPHHQPVVDPNPADGAYVSTAGISQAAPGVDLSQNSGLNEQLAKYSHLSATLVQLLQNRQQLPQLYAAITQQTASALPVAAAPAQPIQASELTRQYDPIGDSLETKVGGSLAEQRSLLGESEIPSGGMTATGDPKLGPNGDDMRRKDHNLNVQGPAVVSDEENGEATGKGAHETQEALNQEGPTDDMAGDSGADDVKKSKDAKGVRQFKFALAEYVKELLKPTWKGGQMSKEVYKTIVKKVVDKVTETIQPAHIPRTKEKIDQYLSASKPKLSKLVQAYLEKHHKT